MILKGKFDPELQNSLNLKKGKYLDSKN